MKKHLLMLALGIGLLGVSLPTFAHHSIQAEYDQSKTITLVGKLTKVMAINPHGFLYFDAKNAEGRVVNWALELPGVTVLRRDGFDLDTFDTMVSSGEEVTITAHAAKDGSKHALAQSLTRADGKTVISLGRGGPFQQRGGGGF